MIKYYSSINLIPNFNSIEYSHDFKTKEEAENWAKQNEVDYNIIYIAPNHQLHTWMILAKGAGRNR